ncbi:MAG: hypothetical protein CVU51_00485 [Deltaproteobacteria bacterium HGW-Deltaproteobacteria-1]|jgi:hypothetical protein|nr:MAG: hypothetical protein CVU51_00485 [Deltaproteobacteria bacterium HGW-Deltaproteobacteria-1]
MSYECVNSLLLNDRFIGELGFGWTESGTWDFGEVDTEDYAYGVNVDYLYYGIFQVKLGSASLFGDFYIDQSVLAINYTPASNNAVPEPATMLFRSWITWIGRCQKKDSEINPFS